MPSVVPLLAVLALLIAAAKLMGALSVRLGQPAVLGELLAGLLLGPSALNVLQVEFLHAEFAGEFVSQLGELGVVFLMFAAGLEMDLADMRRAGRVAVWGGTLGVVAPILMGGLTALAFGYPGTKALFIGIVLSATSVSISAQTLMELGLLRSREGVALLGAAVIDDVLVIVALSLFLGLTGGDSGWAGITWMVARMLLFLALSFLVGLWLLPKVVEAAHRLPVSQGLLAAVLVSALAYAWASEALGGVAAITGAFIAGLGFSRSHLREEIEHALGPMLYGFFVPLFLVSVGLRANLRAISTGDIWFVLAITAAAILSKIAGCGLGARLGGFTSRESLRMGLGMISRGEVGLIVAAVGVGQGVISTSAFTTIVAMILVTTLITPPLLRWAFKPEEADRG